MGVVEGQPMALKPTSQHLLRCRWVRHVGPSSLCVHACGCVWVHVCVRVYVRVHVRVHACVRVYVRVRVRVRVCSHAAQPCLCACATVGRFWPNPLAKHQASKKLRTQRHPLWQRHRHIQGTPLRPAHVY